MPDEAPKRKFGQKLKRFVGHLAPAIGTALGGPFGSMAGGFVADALGVETEDQAIAVLQSDPAALGKVREAEISFKQHLSDNGVQLADIAARNTADARNLAIQKGITPQIVLSIVYSLGYFWVVWLFLSGRVSIPPEQTTMIAALIGVLTAAQAQIMNFWMGSSAGSSKKTDLMAAAAAKGGEP